MPVTNNQLVELYLAYFGRPPDVAGVRFWTANNGTLDDVIRGFSASPESKALYGSTFGVAQINAIYQDLFNRDAEPAGQQFWLEAVNSGSITAAEAALTILQAAQNSDRTSAQNKLTLATEFFGQLDTEREIAGYANDGAAARAQAFLKTVDSSADSLTAARAALQVQVEVVTGTQAIPVAPPAPPPTFAVSKDGSNIVSFSTAGTQITVTEAGGTYTFTSSGGSAGTGTVTGTVAGFAVPTGTTLSIGSALASGKAFSGAGTGLVVANAAGEDLTGFTATGVGAYQLASGQSYTLTAAQAATGRIGAAGVPGTLTDAGSVTVRDTLVALGGGVASTLKANGADSVVASAPPGDISAMAVGGIDNIVLAAGSYTMTAAQAAIANGTSGTQAVTVTTLASGTLAATVESFALGNFANNVTLGAAGQSVFSPSGTATTLSISGLAPTGTWALNHASGDTLVATSGADITGVNAGNVTTAEKLTLTGAITMTRDQHQALTIIATGGSDSVTITSGGAVTARAGVESYSVSSAAANNLFVNAGATTITGSGASATTVTVGGNTVSGSWTLANGSDVISATTGADIVGVNLGAATQAERLSLVGAIRMTAAQYAGLNNANLDASDTSDRIILSTALTGGAVLNAAVEDFTLATGSNNVAFGAAGQSIDATAMATGSSLTLAGSFAGTVSLAGANLIAGGANGGITVTATTAANTITTGSGVDTISSGDGADIITAGGGADVLDGGNGNDTFRYLSLAEFYASGVVVDQINGGADTDAVVISDGIVLTGSSDLSRMTNVEQIKAESTTQRAHSIALNSANLGGVNTIDLSGDTNGSSTATLDFGGVATGMTLRGVAQGVNSITAGTGADTLIGGTKNDLFIFKSAAHEAGDTVTGGGGTDAVLFQSTAGGTLVVGNNFASDLSYYITTGSTAGATAGTTSENIDASSRTTVEAHGVTGVKLYGNGGNNILTGSASNDILVGGGGNDTLRGGAGNDTLTTFVGAGVTTYVFESTAYNNGNDTITDLRASNKFDFSTFLDGASRTLTSQTAGGLDLTGTAKIGVRYGTTSLSTGQIFVAAQSDKVDEVVVADNGRAVVFSFSSGSLSNSSTGTIYYVEDTNTEINVTQFSVFAVGSVNSSSASISDFMSTMLFL